MTITSNFINFTNSSCQTYEIIPKFGSLDVICAKCYSHVLCDKNQQIPGAASKQLPVNTAIKLRINLFFCLYFSTRCSITICYGSQRWRQFDRKRTKYRRKTTINRIFELKQQLILIECNSDIRIQFHITFQQHKSSLKIKSMKTVIHIRPQLFQ